MSELSQYNDDGNVLTHGGLANRKPRGRKPLDYQDKNKVELNKLKMFSNNNLLLSVPSKFSGELSQG